MLTNTTSNAQGQLDPESTGITVDYFLRDQRWLHDRLAPVFTTTRRRGRLMTWASADALPTLTRTLNAPGSTGAEIGITAPTPTEFFINDGQLTSTVNDQEARDAAEDGNPQQPYDVRSIIAAGHIHLELETRIQGYFTPGHANFPAGNIVAASGNWQTENPLTDQYISADLKSIALAFSQQFGVRPNFAIIDDLTDTFFMSQLLRERNASISIGSFTQGADILPTSDGLVVHGMTIIVPGIWKEGTPLDAVYSPTLVWPASQYVVVGFSPTLNGGTWNKVGKVYVAQADMQTPGVVPFQTNRQRDPVEKNKREFMWWDFARQEQEMTADMVMAVGPVR